MTSVPSMSGRPRSSTTRSGGRAAATASAASPVAAVCTSYPRARRLIAAPAASEARRRRRVPRVAASSLRGLQRHHHGQPPPVSSLGRTCRPSPRRVPRATPARGPDPPSCCCRRVAGTAGTPARAGRRGCPAPVDDAQLDAGLRRRPLPTTVDGGSECRRRSGSEVRQHPLEQTGIGQRLGKVVGHVDQDVGPPQVVERPGDRLVTAVGRSRRAWRRAGAGSCRGGSPPGAVSLSSDASALEQLAPVVSATGRRPRLSSPVTAALAPASGVRRSWPTAASRAVRTLVAASSDGRAHRLPPAPVRFGQSPSSPAARPSANTASATTLFASLTRRCGAAG